MYWDFEEKNNVNFIDRTLPEIIKINNKVKRLDIIYFCWLLDNLGINYIEINNEVLNKIKKIPTGINFIFRIEKDNDLKLCNELGISSIIVSRENISNININDLSRVNFDITLEIEIDNIIDIFEKIKMEKFLIYKNIINKIRLKGLERTKTLDWYLLIPEMMEQFNVEIDICPTNKNYNATAVALESIFYDIDNVTMSFLGNGSDGGYAALEEVLVSAKILTKKDININSNVLRDIAKTYTSLTNVKIASDKAIVGENIFDYESGIHASGIEKVPTTYEPFDPDLVGLKRSLKIGKHSGRTSVIKKLRDLGLACSSGYEIEQLLERIRDKSINLKRDLDDGELIDLYIEKCL